MRQKRGKGRGEVGGTIISPGENDRQRWYAIKQKHIEKQLKQIAIDKANVEAMKSAYEQADKTPKLIKR